MLLNPYVFTTGVGTGGPTYFFEERFEGTGYGNSNANGWTESGTGTIDEDYATSPLEGSQSLRLAATIQGPLTTANFASDQAELWAFFRLRINTGLNGIQRFFNIRNSGGTTVGGVQVNTTNNLIVTNGTVGSTATTDALTTGTNYNVWMHWLKGSGSNGTGSVGFSTTGTEPTSGTTFRSMVNGNSTTDAHDLRLGFAAGATGEIVIDQILFSTTATIGNSPA